MIHDCDKCDSSCDYSRSENSCHFDLRVVSRKLCLYIVWNYCKKQLLESVYYCVLTEMPLRGRSFRGFPFDEEDGSGAWSELAARHPDIAARLRQRPATWARKRRPSSQDATDDFGDSFGGFDRFPFDDIPSEFRDHFPSHWNRRFGPREEPSQPQASPPHQHHPQQNTTATQTEQAPGPSDQDQQNPLPQYGLRNTVDLGQKSPADPSLVDADERNQRSMSAPPDTPNQTRKMSGQNHQEQHQPQHNEQGSNVRHIPIFVEGRDEPVINKSVDHGTHFGETKQAYVPPPQPHVDREQYFADDGPVGFHHPPNFTRAFGTPFNKGFRQGSQPFTQQKAYPQTAFARGPSPQRSQSPKPPVHEEPFVKVPVHHEQAAPRPEPARAQQRPPPQQQTPPQQHAPPQQQQQHQQPPHQPSPPQREQTPPKPQQAPINDPITQILSIQTDVLNLMTEVENFTGSKKDKKYLFLDEMLTRNLIKLDNIETEGKENIRLARKEAIRCIQKCIAVLEAKAEKGSSTPQPQDVEMNSQNGPEAPAEAMATEPVTENGEVEMKETTKDKETVPSVPQTEVEQPVQPIQPLEPVLQMVSEQQPQEEKTEEPQPQQQDQTSEAPKEIAPPEIKEEAPPAADTRPEEKAPEEKPVENSEEIKPEEINKTASPKKVTKNVKKRDKSKDKTKQESKDSNKDEKVEESNDKVETMQVDDKGDKTDSQVMEVEGGASQ
ncbi:hypothetical protein K1T71_007431 [Dendrolimus kikuchii]|uniref:Uncharacterized protein n=1 Tax=Dendrolimus kikuchii TaxID=765133 RepID=A0ACC1D0Q2_9NEOP|nr:hypothetical protein K1T71_007431 [Dendrolimus kikuchii]